MVENKDGLLGPNNPASPAPGGVKPPETPIKPEAGVKPPEGKPGTGTPPAPDTMVPHGALHEEREKRKEGDAKLEQIKLLYGDKVKFDAMGNVLPPDVTPPTAPVTPETNVQAPGDLQKRVDEAWERDPKEAVRMEIGLALNWFDQQSAAVDLQRDAARVKYPDYSKWEGEVNSYLRRLPLQQRTQQGIIEMAYKYVKGDKIDQILQAERDTIAAKLAAGESVQGLGPGTASGVPAAPTGTTPTADEVKVAAAMNMTVEDYMKNKAPARGQ